MKGKYGEPWILNLSDDMVTNNDDRYVFHATTDKISGPRFWVDSELEIRKNGLKRAVSCVNLCDGLTSDQIAEAIALWKEKVSNA